MSPPIIVFDLDGTLIDTAPDLIGTLNTIFAREGLPPISYDMARNLVGGGVRAMITRGIEANGRLLTQEKFEQMCVDFIAHYSEHLADRSRPFTGAIEALDELAVSGHRFVICTNKLEHLARLLLQKLKLADRFAAICGQDTFGVQKPNPEILRQTIAAGCGNPRHAIMVGDSLTDIRTARAAGIPIIAVDFGYSEKPIFEFGPDYVISDFKQLPQSVAKLSQKQSQHLSC
jgi:phosphoglycolate phosphatase